VGKIIAGIVILVVSFLALSTYIFHSIGMIGILIGLILMIYGMVQNGKGSESDNLTAPGGKAFDATHRSKNLALDANSGALWCKDDKGRVHVFERGQVTAWEHNWVEASYRNGVFLLKKNVLVLKVASLDAPRVTVKFDRCWDGSTFGSKANHEEAADWMERLNAFYNHNTK
jgi:hypothetical protein